MRHFPFLLLIVVLLSSCGMSSEEKSEMTYLKAQNDALSNHVNKLQDENKELKQSFSKYVKDNPGGDIKDLLLEMSTYYVVIEIVYQVE